MHNVWIHFIHAKNTACFKLKCHFHPRKPSLLSWYQAQYHINLSYLNRSVQTREKREVRPYCFGGLKGGSIEWHTWPDMFTWGFSSSNAFTCVHLGWGDANAFGGCDQMRSPAFTWVEEMQMRSGLRSPSRGDANAFGGCHKERNWRRDIK